MPVSRTRPAKKKTRTAEHRPATRKRLFGHDDLVAVDMFSGFGGLTQGIGLAGFTTILAANHNAYKTSVHEANHPEAEHWIADLVDPESSDYHSARDLPPGDILVAGISCTSHTGANTKKAYARALSLFDLDDPEFEARVTRSERDRATALCVLQYAEKNHPMMILLECTTELVSWGDALPDRPTVGDGTTYRWWRKELKNLDYDSGTLYLNSMFFGVGQSRDRLFIVFWKKHLPAPDLEHRPEAFCRPCDRLVESVWTWKTGIPPTGTVRYGQQYHYTCPRCRRPVNPPATPSLAALDLTDLGKRIGDKPVKTFDDGWVGPLARTTYARAGRCLQRFPDFPPIVMPIGESSTGALTGQVIAAHRHNGDGQHISRPMDTNTATYEKGVLFAAVDNYQGVPRSLDGPLPTQGGSETMALVSTAVLPFRKHTIPTTHAEPMPTVTAEQLPGLVSTAAQLTGNPGELRTQWRETLAGLTVDDLFFRMLFKWEVGKACGFDPDFPGRPGTFKVWGTAKEQIDGYGNAVSPGVGTFLGLRMRASLHSPQGLTIPRQRLPIL